MNLKIVCTSFAGAGTARDPVDKGPECLPRFCPYGLENSLAEQHAVALKARGISKHGAYICIQDLQRDGQFGLKPYDPAPGSDKILRLHAQTALLENGRVLLPASAPWLHEYVHELISFPGSKYDDQVDSTAQALDYMKQHGGLEIWSKL